MFEKIFADAIYQHNNSPTAQAIARMHTGKQWEPPNPIAQPMRPQDRKPRGRSPVETQYKRSEATRNKDWLAWELRMNGYEYPRIAYLLEYHSKQTAHAAVKRAHTEFLCTGIDHSLREGETEITPLTEGSFIGQMPKINVHTLGIKAKARGERECGCYLQKGDLTALVNGRQYCMDHALIHHGLTWKELEHNPERIQVLDLYRVKHRNSIPG